MNNYSPIKRASSCLAAATLLAVGMSSAEAATALNGKIALRPVTPQDIVDYKLTGSQGASGLDTIGLGQPAYLEVLVNSAVPAADITNVTWAIAQGPLGSSATLAASPLGANVPTYKMAERTEFQVAGRTLLRPDAAGQYKVVATIQTASNGDATVEKVITGGTYMGVNTCALCHSGGTIAMNQFGPWSQTQHATMFEEGLNGIASDHYGKNCISCHTVGYDVNTNAVNGGFDDLAKQLDWTFPAVMAPTNWAALPAELKNLGNIQCENCHGPGSQHAYALGGATGDRKISVTFEEGSCAQCHDSGSHHVKSVEWERSGHAVAPDESGSAGCTQCHTARGFANFAAGKTAVATEYEVITCAACHDPHDATNPHQLRKVSAVTLKDKKTTITEGGAGLLCMNCHMNRRDSITYVENTNNISSHFGPHYGPQADMLMGANAITYGKVIPSSAHKNVVEDSCVTCHMQEAGLASTNAAFSKVGGHTFKLKLEASETTPAIELMEACVNCHGEVEDFNFTRQDFDGDGVTEGVQTEVHGLLDKLSTLLPPLGTVKGYYDIYGKMTKSWTPPQVKGAFNYMFVYKDGSFGVHNTAYAVGILKASIADLTGDANNDNLPDWWQVQYFGSTSNPSAAANATPAGDGVPNWLKYSLGIDPTVAGIVMPNGVVWANGKGLVNPPAPGDDTLAIYTAAEIVFKTEAGKSYQIWGSSSMSGGWQKIGAPIAGTGSPVSYVAPTREGTQQFYRVEHTP
jgi:hypothetical protein